MVSGSKLLSVHLSASPKGGALSYNGGYGCAAGTFKPLSFVDQNFGKRLDPLEANGRKFSKIFTLKRRKMNF